MVSNGPAKGKKKGIYYTDELKQHTDMKKIALIFLVLGGFSASAQQKKVPATLRAVLLEQFRDTWVEQDWFVPWMKSLEGGTAKQAAWNPADSSHAIGELAYHIWFWNKESLDKFY